MYCEMMYQGIKNLKYCNISQTRSGGSSPMLNGSSWGGKKMKKKLALLATAHFHLLRK